MAKRLVFDLETNGLLDVVSVVHCLWIKDADTGEEWDFKPGQIELGIKLLLESGDAQVYAHNGIGYDYQALLKVYPHLAFALEKHLRPRLRDTLVLSRMLWPEIKQSDFRRYEKGIIPGNLMGSHSLDAWGHRLGLHKGDYAKEMKAKGLDPWASWNPPMHDYCSLDVDVTIKLLHLIDKKGYSPEAADLEHACAWILQSQMEHGFPFDEAAAADLYAKLAAEREEVRKELQTLVRPWFVAGGRMVPKRDNRKSGYVAGAPFTKIILKEFNPSSDLQVADRLMKLYGWKPTEFTDGGQPKVDGDVLASLPYPIASRIAHYQMLEKRIGQIAEGKEAWLKASKNGVIYGFINQNGAVTGRATHSKPNLAQVPACGKPYGKECRAMFRVPPGWIMLGTDKDGLELRCLAHYVAPYDKGAYIQAILSGDKAKGTDIHSMNARALGLDPQKKYKVGAKEISGRDLAKTFIYAFLYGAGPGKIGAIVGKGAKAGKQLLARFMESMPGSNPGRNCHSEYISFMICSRLL